MPALVLSICKPLSGSQQIAGSTQPTEFVGPLLLAAASAGFLYWNFPPARIFMGNAGSGFLGIALEVLSLQGVWLTPELL